MLKLTIWIFGIISILAIIYLPAYSRMQDLKKTNQEYKEQIVALRENNVQLKEEKRMLIEDPMYLEKVAREKMRLIREGEVLYRIDGNKE